MRAVVTWWALGLLLAGSVQAQVSNERLGFEFVRGAELAAGSIPKVVTPLVAGDPKGEFIDLRHLAPMPWAELLEARTERLPTPDRAVKGPVVVKEEEVEWFGAPALRRECTGDGRFFVLYVAKETEKGWFWQAVGGATTQAGLQKVDQALRSLASGPGGEAGPGVLVDPLHRFSIALGDLKPVEATCAAERLLLSDSLKLDGKLVGSFQVNARLVADPRQAVPTLRQEWTDPAGAGWTLVSEQELQVAGRAGLAWRLERGQGAEKSVMIARLVFDGPRLWRVAATYTGVPDDRARPLVAALESWRLTRPPE